jgi:glucosamine-6-phosphate deaminase
MRWISVENYGKMSRYGAERLFVVIADRLSSGQQVNVGMATGNTMLKLYAVLAGMLNKSGLDLSRLTTFNLDEYVDENGNNLFLYHPLSYRKYMTDNFFDLLDPYRGFKWENMFFPDAAEPDAYDNLIDQCGGLDIQLLGIGFNGHIGFNEPISETEISKAIFAALPSHIVTLDDRTIQTNAQLTAGDDLDAVPRQAVTMGMKSILKAKEIILLACFAEQAEALEKIKTGAITPELPASFLLEHKATEIVYTADKIKLQ